jgi:hypothetical protein
VASVDPDAALNFDECAGRDVGEVGAPLARWVEPKFPFKSGTLNGEPEEFEAPFQAGATVAVAEARAGDYHPLDGESTCAVSGEDRNGFLFGCGENCGVPREDGEPHLGSNFFEATEFAHESVRPPDFMPEVGVGSLFHGIIGSGR